MSANATNQETISVVLVDDHPLFRDGVSARLRMESDITLLGEYDDGGEGLKALRKLHPDVAVLDVNMPTLNGLQVVKQLKKEHIPTRCIVLTAHHDREQTLHVIRTGAHAYAAKDITPDLLVSYVREVYRKRYVIEGKVMTAKETNAWIDETISMLAPRTAESGEEYYTPLSPREMEILTFVTHGKSNKEVAHELDISQQTVKNHMTSILRKLRVDDRTQAAVAAIRHGWVRIQK